MNYISTFLPDPVQRHRSIQLQKLLCLSGKENIFSDARCLRRRLTTRLLEYSRPGLGAVGCRIRIQDITHAVLVKPTTGSRSGGSASLASITVRPVSYSLVVQIFTADQSIASAALGCRRLPITVRLVVHQKIINTRRL